MQARELLLLEILKRLSEEEGVEGGIEALAEKIDQMEQKHAEEMAAAEAAAEEKLAAEIAKDVAAELARLPLSASVRLLSRSRSASLSAWGARRPHCYYTTSFS